MRKAMKIFIGTQVVGGLALAGYLKYQQVKAERKEEISELWEPYKKIENLHREYNKIKARKLEDLEILRKFYNRTVELKEQFVTNIDYSDEVKLNEDEKKYYKERLDRISSITEYYRSEVMRVQKEAQ